jgi:hypothetical protein
MKDLLAVGVFQGPTNLAGNIDNLLPGKMAPCVEQIGKCLALDKLVCQVRLVFDNRPAITTDNVWV